MPPASSNAAARCDLIAEKRAESEMWLQAPHSGAAPGFQLKCSQALEKCPRTSSQLGDAEGMPQGPGVGLTREVAALSVCLAETTAGVQGVQGDCGGSPFYLET